MNTPPNISTREWGRQLEPEEISAAGCEDSCGHGHLQEVWHSALDQWFCYECLIDYYIVEIEAVLGRDTDGLEFVSRDDDVDECEDFDRFHIIDEFGRVIVVTRLELEEVRRNASKSNDHYEPQGKGE